MVLPKKPALDWGSALLIVRDDTDAKMETFTEILEANRRNRLSLGFYQIL